MLVTLAKVLLEKNRIWGEGRVLAPVSGALAWLFGSIHLRMSDSDCFGFSFEFLKSLMLDPVEQLSVYRLLPALYVEHVLTTQEGRGIQ